MSKVITPSIHEEAVAHARLAERAADLAWTHLAAEYTQDIEKVLATLATDEPLAWTLPVPDGIDRLDGSSVITENGSMCYLAGVTLDEIRQKYEDLRKFMEVWGWEALTEIRQGWYVLTHGVATIRALESGETSKTETVTMFPAGADGILGEVQMGNVGVLRENRWPEVPDRPDQIPVPQKRLEALAFHNKYMDALRAEDSNAIVAAHRPDGAAAIRSYLTPQSTVVNTKGAAQLGEYFSQLFERYRVRDIQLVNRVAEAWFVFAELHWVVEERAGHGRSLEFCTAETSPIDPDGKYWVRTGAGTDPVEVH